MALLRFLNLLMAERSASFFLFVWYAGRPCSFDSIRISRVGMSLMLIKDVCLFKLYDFEWKKFGWKFGFVAVL